MANTIVERGRCFLAVVNDAVCESSSDLFLMRSTIGLLQGMGDRYKPPEAEIFVRKDLSAPCRKDSVTLAQ